MLRSVLRSVALAVAVVAAVGTSYAGPYAGGVFGPNSGWSSSQSADRWATGKVIDLVSGAAKPTVVFSDSGGVTINQPGRINLPGDRSAAVSITKKIPWSAIAHGARATAKVFGPAGLAIAVIDYFDGWDIAATECGPASTSCDGNVQWQEREKVAVSPGARLKFGGPDGYDSPDPVCLAFNSVPGGYAGAELNSASSGGGWVSYDCMWRYAPPNPTEPFKSGNANGRYYCGTTPATVVNGAIVCPDDPPITRWRDVPWTYVEPKLSQGPAADPAVKGPQIWPGLLPGGIPDTDSPPTVTGPGTVTGPSTTTTQGGQTKTRTTFWDLDYGSVPGSVVIKERTTETAPGEEPKTEEKPMESPSEGLEHFCRTNPTAALCSPWPAPQAPPTFEDLNDVQRFCDANPQASMCRPFPSSDPASAPGSETPASAPEIETCGLPNKPPCKIDEEGTPTADGALDDATDARDQAAEERRLQLEGLGAEGAVKELPWVWGVSLPGTACTNPTFSLDGRSSTFNVNICDNPMTATWRSMLAWALSILAGLYAWRSATSAVGGSK